MADKCGIEDEPSLVIIDGKAYLLYYDRERLVPICYTYCNCDCDE